MPTNIKIVRSTVPSEIPTDDSSCVRYGFISFVDLADNKGSTLLDDIMSLLETNGISNITIGSRAIIDTGEISVTLNQGSGRGIVNLFHDGGYVVNTTVNVDIYGSSDHSYSDIRAVVDSVYNTLFFIVNTQI